MFFTGNKFVQLIPPVYLRSREYFNNL